MDQDATWYGGRPRPMPRCARWGPSSPQKGTDPPQIPAHVCCGQTAGLIKIPIGTKVGLGHCGLKTEPFYFKNNSLKNGSIFPRDVMLAGMCYGPMSVCLSFISRSSVKTVKNIISQTTQISYPKQRRILETLDANVVVKFKMEVTSKESPSTRGV